MEEQRQALIEERRKASISTKLQKESIAKMMEEVRTNASKANKLIRKAMTGGVTMDSLLGHSSSPSRSRSTEGSRTRKSKTMQARSQSAVGESRELTEADLKYSNALSHSAPQPFVSPYANN